MTEEGTKASGKVRTWALVAVAVTSAFLIGIAVWLVKILSAPDWCNRALGATKYADGAPEFAVGGCFSLMTKQIEALALNSHFAIGILALCLLTLIVIVVAGGKLVFRAGKDGFEGNIGGDREGD